MKLARNQKISPFIISEKKPSVRIFNGRVKIVMMGLMMRFMNAKHPPTIIAVAKEET